MTELRIAFSALSQVEKDTMQERIFVRLKQALLHGELRPGQPVTINSLAETFGTSHMPVREAIGRLVMARALETLPNRSVAVPALSRARLDDIMRVRAEIEGFAAGWAAMRIERPEMAQIESRCTQMIALAKKRDIGGFMTAHQEFHFANYEAARSPTLIPLIETLWLQTGPYLNLVVTSPSFRPGSAEHVELVSALRSQNADKARRAVESGIIDALKMLSPVVKDHEERAAKPPRAARR